MMDKVKAKQKILEAFLHKTRGWNKFDRDNAYSVLEAILAEQLGERPECFECFPPDWEECPFCGRTEPAPQDKGRNIEVQATKDMMAKYLQELNNISHQGAQEEGLAVSSFFTWLLQQEEK